MLCIETDGFYSDAQCSDHLFALTSRPIIHNIKNSGQVIQDVAYIDAEKPYDISENAFDRIYQE